MARSCAGALRAVTRAVRNRMVLELCRELNQRLGTTIVAVLHDLSLAARFCDRLVVLAGGRLAADGTWEEDLRGQVNAYGGNYTVNGDQVVLRDRRGSSETATLQGDELRLPSITLTRR